MPTPSVAEAVRLGFLNSRGVKISVCEWTAIQSMVRRAAKTAWTVNPQRVQQLAGYPLTGCPSAVQFLEMVYNAVVRGE